MHRSVVGPFVVGVLVVMAHPGASRPAAADAESWLTIESDNMTYAFAESMTFELRAASDHPVQHVVLRYTVGDDLPVNRRIPEFAAGRRLVARDHEDLARGSIPPASVIAWWWQVTDSLGRTTTTAVQRERYLDRRFDWHSTSEGAVRVWWYADEDSAIQILSAATDHMTQLGSLVGQSNGPSTGIVAYASQADLRPALANRGAAYEERLATLGARVSPDILVIDAGTRSSDVDEILAHELSHLALHRSFGGEYIEAPLWLDEGLAMYAEGPLKKEEAALLQQALSDDTLMSVRSLTSFPGQADLVPLAYAESRDLVEYLIESRGQEPFRRFVKAVGGGHLTTDSALDAVYGLDQTTLYEAYREARGLGAPVTPSPAEALARRQPAASACPAALAMGSLAAMAGVLGRRGNRRPDPRMAPEDRPSVAGGPAQAAAHPNLQGGRQ